jgi:hypothetical protein
VSAFEAHEHAEHAKHASHHEDMFGAKVSITIALLAVAAAVTSSLETYESAGAIIAANEAVLAQNKATDTWNLYEAKSLKKNLYALAADAGGAKAAGYAAKATSEGADEDSSKRQAEGLESDSRHALAVSQAHEARHHRLTLGATLLEIGIATSTIAIITRRRWSWIASSILGLAGAAVAISAYILL